MFKKLMSHQLWLKMHPIIQNIVDLISTKTIFLAWKQFGATTYCENYSNFSPLRAHFSWNTFYWAISSFSFITFSFPNLLIFFRKKWVKYSKLFHFYFHFPMYHRQSTVRLSLFNFVIWPSFNSNYWPLSRIQIFVKENKICDEFSFWIT